MGTTWLVPHDLGHAVDLVAAGATPVGGGVALLSAALPPRLADSAVDLAPVLPAGQLGGGRLGAGTTLARLAGDPQVRRWWPALAAAAAATGTPQVRALATLGGTVAARLATADLAAPLVAYGALVHVRTAGADRARELPVREYLGAAGLPPHIVVEVELPVTGDGAYRRFALRAGPAPAVATVAAVRPGGGEPVLVAGAVGRDAAPVPFPGPGPEPPPAELLRSDARGSAGFRHALLRALAREAITELEAT
ncbi:MAG: FAD binding domain-containing protein [Frankia sp.]|nr:FAD binding domain-containing protein [Frankia sp.]